MTHTEKITLSPNARINFKRLSAKQYDINSMHIVCTLSGFTQSISASDTAKASAYINQKTVDVIDCDVDSTTQTISFTLTSACLMQSGLLLIDVSILSGDTVKLTAGAIAIDVVKSADVNVQNKNYGLSLADKLSSIIDLQTFNMAYNSKTTTLIDTDIFTLSEDKIASNSPVNISIQRGGGNSTLVRADGVELIDQLTGNVVDVTMTEVEITADDVLAGVKLTEGGAITVSYYHKNCEDLCEDLSNSKKLVNQLSADVTELQDETLKNVSKETISAIDESSIEGEYALMNTRRWFLDLIIPKGATVSEFCYHTYMYGQGTVTFEFWEKDGDTLTKVYSIDSTATISSLINVDVEYTATKDTMISILSTSAAVSYTTDGGSILVSRDMTSDVLDYTTLATWTNFTPNCTIRYITYTPIHYVKKNNNIITVGNSDCDYNSIQDALENITDDAEDNPYTILVYPSGTPYSRFSMLRKLDESYPWSDVAPRHISIIGLDKAHCVIQSDNGEYTTPPSEALTNGIIKNLTFKMTNESPLETPSKGGYACHIDCRTLDDVGYTMIFEDCEFESATGPAVGIGLHPNAELTFRRCHFISTAKEDYAPNDSYKNLSTYGCVFAHTSQLADAQNQRLTFEDCVGACEEGTKSIWIAPSGDYSQDTSDFVYTLLRNIFWNNKTENSAYVIGTTLTANPDRKSVV